MNPGKKLGLIAATLGAVLLAIILTVAKFPRAYSSASSADPWNSHAIEGTFAGVRVREIDANNAAVVFFYDLDNRTVSDYQLAKGPNVKIMGELKTDGSLSSEQQVELNSSIFLPAGNRARIALEISHPFVWPAQVDDASDSKFRELVASEVADLKGFVLFDQTARYQVFLPGSWTDLDKTPVTAGRN